MNSHPDYSNAWTDYKRRKLTLTILFVGWITLLPLTTLASVKLLGIPNIVPIIVIPYFLAIAHAMFRFNTFTCPRCGLRLNTRGLISFPLSRSCMNCGLAKYSNTDIGENKLLKENLKLPFIANLFMASFVYFLAFVSIGFGTIVILQSLYKSEAANNVTIGISTLSNVILLVSVFTIFSLRTGSYLKATKDGAPLWLKILLPTTMILSTINWFRTLFAPNGSIQLNPDPQVLTEISTAYNLSIESAAFSSGITILIVLLTERLVRHIYAPREKSEK